MPSERVTLGAAGPTAGNREKDRGVVIGAEGSGYWVNVGGEQLPCVLRGRMKKKQLRTSSLVVVGDEVVIERLPGGGAVIEDRLERRSELVRPGPSGGRLHAGPPHVIAANLDQLVIVQSAHQPDFKRRLAERFLATAAHAGLEALVVLNKCDLEDERVISSWIEPLVASGVEVLLTSAYDGRGIDELRRALVGRVSCLAGQSGVGKSSLLNAMFPENRIRTNTVSEVSNKGRHTTSSSRLYPLPGGGYVADTPGIKALGLFDEVGDEIGGVFAEIDAAAAGCKFRDCSHTHEPGCAVKDAVERGEIDEDRYRNYVRLRRHM